ncbi:MAG: hypothetical protein ABJC51_07540, partial [Acidobacteriota bacterium]
MGDSETLRLTAAMAAAPGRFIAAQALARHLGASAIVILVHDRVIDALVPAPGFPQTLPGGAGWREFLVRLRNNGFHHGTVGFPRADQPVSAVAWSTGGIAMV